jgi:hypothetical protein
MLASLEPTIDLVNRILNVNRTSPLLEDLQVKATNEEEGLWTLQDGLLLRNGRLVVLAEDGTSLLRTELLKEVHTQPSTAHPGKAKMIQLLQARYYWKGMGNEVTQYVRNYASCRRARPFKDKTPGLLQPLTAPERP